MILISRCCCSSKNERLLIVTKIRRLSKMVSLCMRMLRRHTKCALKTLPKRSIAVNLKIEDDSYKRVEQENWEIRCQLATAYRALNMYGLNEGIDNHLTARAPSLSSAKNVLLILPYGMHWSQATPENLIGVDMETQKVVEGRGMAQLTGLSIHHGIYTNRPDIMAAFHVHPTYTTVLSTFQNPTLRMIHQTNARFLRNVAYDSGFSKFSDINHNDEGDRIGKALGNKDVLLMLNHGLTSTGKTVARALDDCYYFEKAAQTQVIAQLSGEPLSYFSDEVAETTCDDWMDWIEKGSADLHLSGLRKVFEEKDETFINEEKFDYTKLLA